MLNNKCHLIVRFQRSAAFEVGFRGLAIVECELRLAAPEPCLGRLRVLLDRLVSEEFDYGPYTLNALQLVAHIYSVTEPRLFE